MSLSKTDGAGLSLCIAHCRYLCLGTPRLVTLTKSERRKPRKRTQSCKIEEHAGNGTEKPTFIADISRSLA